MIKLEVTDSGELSLDVEGIAIDVMAGLCAGVGVLAEKLANLAFDTREERLAFAEQLAACLQKAYYKAIGPKEGEIVSLDSKRRSCRGESQDH